MENTPPVVTFEDVSFGYLNTPVLRDVCFTVNAGESIGIIGPNGGGKTTLLKLLMGFLPGQGGKISIYGKQPSQAHELIAYVPQLMRFDKQFPISVLELVLQGKLNQLPWWGWFSEQDREAAHNVLKVVDLAGLEERSVGSLSGGQMQRALIARALISEPKLLVLDEPTASVDSHAEALIYDLLKKLKGKMTILMVTHDLASVINNFDRVLCVQGVVTSFRPEEVCHHFGVGLYHAPLVSLGNAVAGEMRAGEKE